MGELRLRNYQRHNWNGIEMHIDEADTNMLLEVLANRGIDARVIKEYSMTELNNEITRRRMEAERAECANAEADADQAHMENDARAQAEAEAIAEDNAKADQEKAEEEAQAAQAQADAEIDAELHDEYEELR